MTLRLYPLPNLFDEDVLRLKRATPVLSSAFYLRRPLAVPWSANPTTFILETTAPDEAHEFTINRTEVITFVPGVESQAVQFQLRQGANRIDVRTPSESFYVTVAATGIETWFRALGREFYLSVARRLRDVQAHFATPWTTRVSAHLLPYTDIFLPARMPKVQQTRLAILTSVGGRLGHGDGVLTVATAVSYSTPPVSQVRDAEFTVPERDFIYPGVTSFPTTGEDRGRLLDLWYPNQCLAAKDALVRLALAVGAADVPSPKPLRLIDFDDLQVLLSYTGGATEVHGIDPTAAECADIEFSTVCDPARVFAEMRGILDIIMMSPQLPFDEVVESPINFGFWDSGFALDESTGSGEPGLGGDDAFDGVDPDDIYGDGFEGFSLSRRLDAPACLDTRVQVGRRMVMAVSPLASLSSLTPADDQAGLPLVVDAKSGAPTPFVGMSVLWGTTPRHFIYEGDYIRFEEPDAEIQVASAWPVFTGPDTVIKTTAAATDGSVGTQKIVAAPAGFFEPRHEGLGLRVAGAALYTIVRVNATGTQATVAGNPAPLPGGAFIASVYEPLRDRNETAFLAGRRTFEVTLATPLLENHGDGDVLDVRWAPRVVGAFAPAATIVQVASDVRIRPGDLLYTTTSTLRFVESAYVVGQHHTSGISIWELELDPGIPLALSDNQALYTVRVDPCFANGDPVTPLMLINLTPPAYITP